MMLYILRHATAEEAASSGDDGARKLTERSKEKMRGAASGLRAMGLKFDVILTSPLARAAETAEIVSAAYENIPPPQVLPALATGVAATDAVTALRAFSKHENVMIVGHEPQLSAVASILLTGASDVVHLKLKTGGCIAIDLPRPLRTGRRRATLDANPPPTAHNAQIVPVFSCTNLNLPLSEERLGSKRNLAAFPRPHSQITFTGTFSGVAP